MDSEKEGNVVIAFFARSPVHRQRSVGQIHLPFPLFSPRLC